MSEAVTAYPQNPRTEWVLSWPGQVVLASSIIYWTMEVTQVGQEKILAVNEVYDKSKLMYRVFSSVSCRGQGEDFVILMSWV